MGNESINGLDAQAGKVAAEGETEIDKNGLNSSPSEKFIADLEALSPEDQAAVLEAISAKYAN